MLMLIITSCLFGGMLTGFLFRKMRLVLHMADKLGECSVYVLLFALGAGIGQNDALFSQLPVLGLTSLAITLACSAGSVLALLPLRSLLGGGEGRGPKTAVRSAPSGERSGSAPAGPSPVWSSLRILFFFLSGIILGRTGVLPEWLGNSGLVDIALYFLIFFVGMGLGRELRAFLVLRDMHLKVLAVPLAIIAGSLAGAAVVSLILPLSLHETLTAGAGLGYYSLPSLLVEQATNNTALASITLLANMFRELAGILTAPVLARLAGPLSPVGVAGATAMDTGLPGIARFSGERYAIIAVFSGMVLTLFVPFLVSFVLEWGLR